MTIRLGLVGHGRWGRIIARTLQPFDDVSLRIIAKGEAPPPDLDGVVIANQSAAHAQAALPYIATGIATFIEKPMATNVIDAENIRDTATRSGAVVCVGHIFLHHPAFAAALRLLPSFGAVRYLLGEGMNGRPRTDTSVLWDHLPHDLSMARAIFGRDPRSVMARTLSGAALPQAALSIFHYGDVPLVSTVSWLSAVPRRQLTVVCDKATLVFDDKASRKLMIYDREGIRPDPDYSGELPLTAEMRAFLEAVRRRRPDKSEIELGLGVIRAIAAAERSIQLGGQTIQI